MASDELSQLLEDFPEDTLEKLLTAATESRKASKKHKLSQILQALADEGSIKSVIAQLKTSVESTHASIHPSRLVFPNVQLLGGLINLESSNI